MPIILEVGLILTVMSLALAACGYAWSLPGYNRKKMLAGYSAGRQMYKRKLTGENVQNAGLAIASSTFVLFFIVLGLFLPVGYAEREPESLNVMVAQGKTIVLADGRVHTFDEAYYHIKRIYYSERTCSYGFAPGFYFELKIEEWKREEVVGR